MTLLHIDSSILGDKSVSRVLSRAVVDHLVSGESGTEVIYHDLGAHPVPHLSGQYLAGQSDDVKHNQALQEDLSLGGRMLEEFLAADTVVIGVAFYNFGVPSQLKAWIDRVTVAGKTFRYTEKGPVGLAGGKRVVLAVARGGLYGPGSPFESSEHAVTYLKAILGFMGITRVEVVVAEGVALGAEQREQAIAAAREQVAALAA